MLKSQKIFLKDDELTMPLNCKTCGAPLKGDEEHCPYCGSFIDYEDRPVKNKKPERENKNLPQIKYASEAFIITVSIFTFGIYGIYWYFSRRKSLNGLVEGFKFPDIALGIYIVGWLMFMCFTSSEDPELASESSESLAGIGCIIIWVGAAWMSFSIKKILLEYLKQNCKDEAVLKVITFSDVMLFIFGYIYLQIQINKMINAEFFAPN